MSGKRRKAVNKANKHTAKPIKALIPSVPVASYSSNVRGVIASLSVAIVIAIGFGLLQDISALASWSASPPSGVVKHSGSLMAQYNGLKKQSLTFEKLQSQNEVLVINPSELEQRLASIKLDLEVGNAHQAKKDISSLSVNLSKWQIQLNSKLAIRQATLATSATAAGSLQVPILLYHYAPSDFDSQLTLLSAKGYSVVTLDDVAAALRHQATLPSKPVVITFDDGFSSQLQSFEILKKHNMKATYYIIDAGEESRWCIGAGRRFGDLLQPSGGCGDAYINWDQVRMLDRSGLITIAAHTIDHVNLPSKSVDEQRRQIFSGKAQLEAELGHPIYHFAYPYGTYNAATLALVQEAGFTTAVSTLPGMIQSPQTIFSLHRVREIKQLP